MECKFLCAEFIKGTKIKRRKRKTQAKNGKNKNTERNERKQNIIQGKLNIL